MNEENKSLELAKIMEWDIEIRGDVDEFHQFNGADLCPYDNTNCGLVQFAKIILKHPFYVNSFNSELKQGMTSAFYSGWSHDFAPTQKNTLDEILRNNGVEI